MMAVVSLRPKTKRKMSSGRKGTRTGTIRAAYREMAVLLGLYTDRFDTDRWLVRGRLMGDFRHGNWLFSPHAGVIYFEEDQLNG